MKNLIMKLSCAGFLISLCPSMLYAESSGYNSANECFEIDRFWGADSFWFCGEQSRSCRGNKVGGGDAVHMQTHGDSLDREGLHWCCAKDPQNSSGTYVRGDEFIIEEKLVTETVKDSVGNPIGKCTWTQKINVCGWVENESARCTEPVEDLCEDGFAWRKKAERCIKVCAKGYAYAGEDNNTCEKIDPNDPTQGVLDDYIVHCEDGKMWDKKKKDCFEPKQKTALSQKAFEECWKCEDAVALKDCVIDYTDDATLKEETKKVCGI